MNDPLTYSEMIQDLKRRLRHGKTQRDLCAEVGINEAHFSHIINETKVASRRVIGLLGYETVYRRKEGK